jgi:hypothetical protein
LERPPFWYGWSYGVRNYGAGVTFNGITSLPNFIKIYQLVKKLIRGRENTDWMVTSLAYIFPLERKVG